MKKIYYSQALFNGISIRGSSKETKAIVTSKGKVIIRTKSKNDHVKFELMNNIPLIRGIIILIQYLVSFVFSLNDSAELIEEELDEYDNNRKISKKFNLYFIDILIFISILMSIITSFILIIIIPSVLVYLLDMIIKVKILDSIVEGILRIGMFYLLLKLSGKIKKIADMYMYHGAFHKINQCFKNGEPLTVKNIKKYKCYDSECGLSFIFNTMIVCVIVFSIIQIINPLVLSSLSRIVYSFLISGILYELMFLAGKYKDKLFFIGTFFQKVLIKEPTDEILILVKKAFETNLEEKKENNDEINSK